MQFYLWNFYTTELLFRFLYVLLSWIICSLYFFKKIYLLFILYSISFFKLNSKKLLILHSMELFNSSWIIVLTDSILFTTPLFIYFLFTFLSSSWHKEQILYFKKIIMLILFLIFLINYYFFNFLIFLLLNLLLNWNFNWNFNSLSILEVQLQLYNFVFWVLTLNWNLIFFLSITFTFITKVHLFLNLNLIFNLFKFYKQHLLWIFMFFMFLVSNSEISIQVFFFVILYIFFELIYFWICYKFSFHLNKITYGDSKPNHKKIYKTIQKKIKINGISKISSKKSNLFKSLHFKSKKT